MTDGLAQRQGVCICAHDHVAACEAGCVQLQMHWITEQLGQQKRLLIWRPAQCRLRGSHGAQAAGSHAVDGRGLSGGGHSGARRRWRRRLHRRQRRRGGSSDAPQARGATAISSDYQMYAKRCSMSFNERQRH